jgi:dolichol-phosphate mannosyltransferase
MSGFFMLTRPAFEGAVRGLSGYGFKILLDLFASTPTVFRFKEIPFVFRRRFAGESKLDQLVAWEYLLLLLDKSVGRYVPVRFLLFSGIGAFGIAVHLAVLRIALMMLGFSAAQGMAALAAMTNNFFLNNWLTYRDRRLRGWRAVTGLLSFWAVCSVGLVANVGVATLAFRQEYEWWVSGLAGAAISAVWNYAASAVVTWSSK